MATAKITGMVVLFEQKKGGGRRKSRKKQPASPAGPHQPSSGSSSSGRWSSLARRADSPTDDNTTQEREGLQFIQLRKFTTPTPESTPATPFLESVPKLRVSNCNESLNFGTQLWYDSTNSNSRICVNSRRDSKKEDTAAAATTTADLTAASRTVKTIVQQSAQRTISSLAREKRSRSRWRSTKSAVHSRMNDDGGWTRRKISEIKIQTLRGNGGRGGGAKGVIDRRRGCGGPRGAGHTRMSDRWVRFSPCSEWLGQARAPTLALLSWFSPLMLLWLMSHALEKLQGLIGYTHLHGFVS